MRIGSLASSHTGLSAVTGTEDKKNLGDQFELQGAVISS